MLMTKTERPLSPVQRELEGETAIVTGSTSGIGLGIARALAQRGANVVLNGFGDAGEIEIVRGALAAENDVEVAYDGADMSKPEAIHRMIELRVSPFRTHRHSRQQRRHPACGADRGIPARQVGCHSRHQSERRVSHDACRFRRDERARLGPHRECRIGPRSRRLAVQVGLCGRQARRARPDQGDALEGADHGITCNAICPGYVWTPLVEKQIDDQARSHGIPREQVVRDVMLVNQPTKKFATVEEIGALTAFLCGEAAASIAGTALPVDGGWTAR